MAVMARASKLELPELGYESMSHFVIDIDDLADTLRNINFCCSVAGDEEDFEEVEEELDFGSRF